MRYTVVWEDDAERWLTERWNAGPDRAAVAAAANAIDRAPADDPARHGEARAGDVRILIIPPLAVLYEVRDLDCIVSVFAVWRWSKSP